MNAIYFIFVITSVQAISINTTNHEEWINFQIKFGKNYQTIEEANVRFSIFKENLRKIEKYNYLHQAGNVTHRQGLTPFTDWTREEFSSYVNRFQFKRNKTENLHKCLNNKAIPDFVDWRLKGAVTEVKNQGHCGSCWSFSVTGVLEGQAKLALGKRVLLSEQNLIDCAVNAFANYGCNGGDTNIAFSYVQSNGIEKEQDYPYVAKQGKCTQTHADISIRNYYDVEASEQSLKEAVASVGPISVAIESTSELQNYVGGVFFDRTCTEQLNHAVLVVGYGTENGREYWLIKNSWGPSWGEQGYFKLARNEYNNCGVASYASYARVLDINKE